MTSPTTAPVPDLPVRSGRAASLGGRAETSVPFTLDPGQRRRITATMLTGRGQVDEPVLTTTPGVRTIRNDVAIPSACG